MNDPNGVCWYKGSYHLFYQYNPDGDQWGKSSLGTCGERGLRSNWNHLPVALAPSRELGEIHCFSGCASTDGERPPSVLHERWGGRKTAETAERAPSNGAR